MVAPDSRLLKPRNINRLVLLLAFLAPIVYLFGTQFFALAGAHGEEVLAGPDDYTYSDVFISGDSFVDNVLCSDTYGVYRNSSSSDYFYSAFYSSFNDVVLIDFDSPLPVGVTFYVNYYNDDNTYARSENFSTGSLFRLSYFTFSKLGFTFSSSSGVFKTSFIVKTLILDDNTGYSDVLFGSMFNEDNFLADLGRESLKDNPKGFAPYGSLIKFLDDTVFHMSDNSLALMGYGYVYYCGHVVLLDLIAMILLFIPRIIAMVLEFVTKGVDSR